MSIQTRTDENLLFGILALQMDFISRDALIAAMNAWVLDKAKSLGRILLEQQALNTEEYDLLQALVQKHVDKHGGDAQRSLASVSSLGSARQQLEQIADADLHQSLIHVAVHRASEDDPLATQPPTVGEPTSSGLRFRILRPHAEGGLGKVFVARDEELRREVALKEIKDRLADDPDKRSRFLLEAEITGGLEHPCIVPVYGLGQYADGRPFYAMRFIKGDSLQDAIARFHRADTPDRDAGERTLALRKLLGRFLDVCNAIAYAHARGVLHRDLKPGNIMLGKFGETLVVDWGLAKPLGRAEKASESIEGPLQPFSASGSNRTQMGSAIGTPAYMPPEQAAGRLDQLGPASDVYSLGATLYCLLTGAAPFEGTDIGAVLRQVEHGEFRRPREIKPQVAAALEAVCLKAMTLNPEDRYASPRALAEDIEHWLADEPVSAYCESWMARSRRWIGRHRTLVTASAATLLVATISLTVATILLQAANARERQANADKDEALRQKDEALRQKDEALRQAEDNAAEARHQEKLALEQKRQTEKAAAIANAVNNFLQLDLLGQADIGQQMVAPGEQRDPDVKVRTLLDRASRSIEGKFKDEPLEEAAIRLAIGCAYRELGIHAESQRHLERSLQLRKTLLGADHPQTLPIKNNLAMLYQFQGKYDLAEPLFKEVLQSQSANLGTDHPDIQSTKHNLGTLYLHLGKFVLAEPLLKEALQASTAKLGTDHSSTLLTKNSLAALYLYQSKYDSAEPLLKEVLQAMIAKLGPDHPHTLAIKSNLAGLYASQGRYDLAEPLFKEVLQTQTAKLGPDHPNTLASKHSLALLYLDQGKYDSAEPLSKQALQASTAKLGTDHPLTLAAMAGLCLNLLRQKRYSDAEPILRELLAIRIKKQPDQWTTFSTSSMLGEALAGQKKYAEAEPLLLQGHEGMKQREKSIPPPGKVRLIEGLERLVRLYDASGKKDKADDYRKQLAAERAKSQPAKK